MGLQALHAVEGEVSRAPARLSELGPTGSREIAELIARLPEWEGEFEYGRSKPDGMPRKVMDVSRLRALGWQARTPLEEGMRRAYDWYVKNAAARLPQP